MKSRRHDCCTSQYSKSILGLKMKRPAQCVIYLILAGLHVQKHSCTNVSLAPYISHCVRDSRTQIGGSHNPAAWVWSPETRAKAVNIVIHICNPNSLTERWEIKTGDVAGHSQPSCTGAHSTETRIYLRDKVEGNNQLLESCPLISAGVPWHTHDWIYTHYHNTYLIL